MTRNIGQHTEIYNAIIGSYGVTPLPGGIYEPFGVRSFVSCVAHYSAQSHLDTYV